MLQWTEMSMGLNSLVAGAVNTVLNLLVSCKNAKLLTR
jgi:hypothetical protein